MYDEDGAVRKAKGSKGAFVFHSADDPNHVFVLTNWENLESAKNFAESDDLRITMQKAGVNGRPEVYYLEKIERTPQ
ncbi:MAG: antibiotic biosynthesis monooxygenase family protein [Methanobacterium sp.]